MSPINYDLTEVENRPMTVGEQFYQRVEKSADKEAFRYPVGEHWESVTWREAGDQVTRLAAGLVSLGLQQGERAGIASGTRYEWIVSDLAIMCAGGATTTVYPSTMADDVAFILSDSDCRIVFAEDDEQIAKLVEKRSELPNLAKVVTYSGKADGDWVISYSDLEKLGDELLATDAEVVRKRVDATTGTDLATLIYTSGTTGRPKGVRLLHASSTYEGAAIAAQDILDESDLQFLWLPMAHVFGKVLVSTQLACGFPTAIDGRVDKIIDNLPVVRPTFMGAAPRIFEKVHSRIMTMQEQEGGLKKKIFDAAFHVGRQVEARKAAGKSIPPHLAVQHAVLDKLVFAKIRARFGGRVRFFISGAAALNREIAEWFHIVGILILEGYGMTETSAGSAVNHPEQYEFGTVGLPFPGTEIKIAEDGEILIKGPGVMDGYHNNPEATAEALTDGWMHTGDIGEFTPGGLLKITDRKKDLFKTSGGKYIAPTAIEAQFKTICPYASQFLVHGAERNFCSALIALDPEAIVDWANHNGLPGKSYEQLVASKEVNAMLQKAVDELNAKLNRWETIKKFIVLDHDLTVESGEMTPSLKVKRKVVEDNNREAIDALYA